MPKKDEPLIIIDLVRFTCAMMVMIYHFVVTSWLEPTPIATSVLGSVTPPNIMLIALSKSNWIGVQIFFVISGMVIAQSADKLRPMDFLEKRLLRIVPGVFLCATATAVVLTAAGEGDLGLLTRWCRSIAFWPLGSQIDPSYWTLGIELSFYLLVSLFIHVRRSAGAATAATILIFGSGAFWAALALGGRISGPIGIGTPINLMLLPHGCFFALGIVFTLAAKTGLDRALATKMALALLICCAEIIWKAHERSAVGMGPVDFVTPLAGFLTGVALLAATWRLQPLLARWVPPQRAREIGLLTYPLYLLHQEAGRALIGFASKLGFSTESAIGVAVVVALAAAWLVAAVLEPRMRHVLQNSRNALRSLPTQSA
jgi:peptidoglycan/LPS O-acetylase OafA/YrhL